jgi:PAS domain S-box-containing protein
MYTWLAAALFFGTLYLSGIKGAAFQYLWPNSVWWTTYSIPISILLASVPMIEFARLFTNIKTISYKLERFLYYFKALMVICIFTGMFMPYGVIIRICTVTTIILGFVCMMVGIGGWRNGDTSARLFVLAWTSFFLSSTAFAFNSLGLLPKAFIVEWAQEVGYLLFAILMTVAMFDRYLQVQTNQRRQQDSALKSLAYAEKKYRSLFENALEGLFEMNHEGGLKSTNAAFKRIVGLNEAQPGTDHSFTLGFLSESQALHFKSKLQDDGHINNYLVELQGDEAEYRWLSISAHKVSDKNDETYRFEGSIDDITETKKREQAESRVRRAEVEGETRSLILNNVSAEIKKPVTNIIKLTEDALVLQPNKVLHSKLDDVKGESLKLLLRINDILDFSAMEMGKLKLNNESFTLTDMQTQFQQMLSAFEKESLVNISLEVADDIPKSLLGDYQRITQVFASLLGQVLKQRGDLSRLTLTLGLRSLSRRSGNVKLRGSILVSDSAAGSLGNSEGVPKNLELNSDSTISQRLIDLMQGSISLNPRSDCLVEFNFVCRVDSRQSKKEESVVVLDSNPLLPQDVVEPVTDSQALESNVVDFDVGLSRCQGNERLYRQILSEFVEDYQDFSSKLQMQCDAGDLDALSNLAHTLKGVASNIGAGQLSGIALELEEGGDRNITILLGALDRELKASLSQIHDFLNIQSLEGSRDASDSSEGEKEKLGCDAVLEALQELSTLIRGKKVDAYDQAVLLSEQWPLEWGKEALANLVDLVDQFEFEQAEEALEPILEAAGKA